MPRFRLLLPVLVSMTFAGCELVGDIFQAGAWAGACAVIGDNHAAASLR